MEAKPQTGMSQPDSESQRKEIFDYLRNEQKQEEKRSKVSGLTSWALVAAVCLLIWEITKLDRLAVSAQTLDLTIRVLAIAWLLYISANITIKDRNDKSLRFQNLGDFSFKAPVLVLGSIIWFFVPCVAYSVRFTSFAPINAIPAALLLGLLKIGLDRIFDGTGRFPAPRFNSQGFSDSLYTVIGFSIFLLLQVQQDIKSIANGFGVLSMNEIRSVLLLVAIYWVIYLLLEKQVTTLTADWAHRIERYLLIGTIDAKEAIRQIEQRVLGTRLSIVLDEFWDELRSEQRQCESDVKDLQDALAKIQTIPEEFSSERASRLSKPTTTAIASASRVIKLHKELRRFTAAALKSQKNNPTPIALRAFQKLLEQHDIELKESERLVTNLDSLTDKVRSLNLLNVPKRDAL